MTPKIHPHWKSTEDASPKSKKEHITISRGGYSTFASKFLFAAAVLVVLAFVFMQGVRFITADLTEGLTPDSTITFTDDGFAGEVDPGAYVEFLNGGTVPDQYRTTQLNPNGSPLIAIPLLGPGETYRLVIPKDLAGRTLTFVSETDPSRRGSIVISEALSEPEVPVYEAPAPEPTSPDTSELVVTEVTIPPLPSLSLTPIQIASSIPTPTPASTSLPPPSAQPVVIDIGDVATAFQTSKWPSLLRINLFTVGSSLVANLSPIGQMPLHIVRDAQEQVHAAAGTSRPPARRQPATGPALWIVAFFSLCSLPFFVKRRKS